MKDRRRWLSSLIVAGSLVAASLSAQTLPPCYPALNAATPYTGDMILPHSGTGTDTVSSTLQRYRVYLPHDPDGVLKPVAGWPVLIHFELSGFASSESYGDQICDNSPQRFAKFLKGVLDARIAVITVTATPTADLQGVPGASWFPEPEAPPGGGRFHPPGFPQCSGVFDYYNPDVDCGEKDAVMIMQHVRHYAGDPTSSYADHMKDLDRTRIAVHGSSGGAIALMWVAFGPERRGLFDVHPPYISVPWCDQYDQWTRPDIAVLREGLVWWPAQLISQDGYHFTHNADCGAYAPTLQEVAEDTLIAASALAYDVDALNDALPTFLYYCEMFNATPPACLAQPTGICNEENNVQENRHSAWHGMKWWARHQESTVLALQTSGLGIGGAPSADVHDQALIALQAAGLIADINDPPDSLREIDPADPPELALDAQIVTWLGERFADIAANPWTSLWVRAGPPPAGPPGTTAFRPNGELDPGCNILLPISSAPAGTDLQLWIAAWPTTLVDNGCGEVIANPDLIVPLQADGTGRVTYVVRWEELPSQVANIFQVIALDPGEPCGYEITDTWIADTELGT